MSLPKQLAVEGRALSIVIRLQNRRVLFVERCMETAAAENGALFNLDKSFLNLGLAYLLCEGEIALKKGLSS